jgi:hypothetical protein
MVISPEHLHLKDFVIPIPVSATQLHAGDMLASLYALRDLLVTHFSQQSTAATASSVQLQQSVLVTAHSLLSDVHYGGRVKAASDQQVLASVLSCTVIPVVKVLLHQDGHSTTGDVNAIGAQASLAARIALQFNVDECSSVEQMMEAVSSMPGLDSSLELLGIDEQTAEAWNAQQTRDCSQDTHAAAMWLRANGTAPKRTENASAVTSSIESTVNLMETCKGILAVVQDDLSSLAQQKVCLSLDGGSASCIIQFQPQPQLLHSVWNACRIGTRE